MAPARGPLSIASCLLLLVLFGCTSRPHPQAPLPLPTASNTPTPGPEFAPAGPGSDVLMATFRVRSLSRVVQVVSNEAHFPQVLVLLLGRPVEVQVWYSAHYHAKTIYRVDGHEIAIVQTAEGGLPSAPAVDFRGSDAAVREGGTVYWLERSYYLALSPATRLHAASLAWRGQVSAS